MSYFDLARMVLALSDLLARSLHVVCRYIGKFYCKYPYDITAPHIINIASLEACEHMLVGSDVGLCVLVQETRVMTHVMTRICIYVYVCM